jgi:cholesterol transport system auxiliary component
MNLRAMILLAPLACAGCVSLLPEPPPPPRVYQLSALDGGQSPANASNVVVAVASPNASRAIGGGDIVWRQNRELAFMERSAWDGAAVDLLQIMLIDTLDRSGAVRTAVRVGEGVRADFEIRWDIEVFEVREETGTLSAHFAANARLIDVRTRAVIDDTRVHANAPIAERSGRVAAEALQSAAQEGAGALSEWVRVKAQAIAVSSNR